MFIACAFEKEIGRNNAIIDIFFFQVAINIIENDNGSKTTNYWQLFKIEMINQNGKKQFK